jgi:multidrug resistance efflux pump
MTKAVIMGCVLAAGILGWLILQQRAPTALIVSGFIEADEVRVGSRVGGRVSEVLVEEGQRVSAGAPLYRLDPFDLRETLAEARARREAAQAELDRLRAGYRSEEIEQARAKRERTQAALDRLLAGPRAAEIEIARQELNRARAILEWAASEHERLSNLQARADAAPVELNVASRTLKTSTTEVAAAEQQLALLLEGSRKEDIAEAQSALRDAEQALQLLESGFRKEDVARAAAQLAAADAAVAGIETRLAETTVTSPCDCVVEATDLRPGDLVAANAPTISLLDSSALWVRAYVPEARLAEAAIGKVVRAQVDSFPNESFTGRIAFVARDAEFTPRNVQTPEE